MTRKRIWISGDALPSFTNWLNSNGANSSSFSIVSDYIQMSFSLASGGNQYRYDDMSSISDYVIQSGDYLEYDIYWETAGAILLGMDFGLSDGNEFRDSGSVDQNSLSVHPSTDISARASGQWYHRKIPFTTFTGGSSIGKTVQKYALVSEFDGGGTKIARIKNIAITDGNGIDVNVSVSAGVQSVVSSIPSFSVSAIRNLSVSPSVLASIFNLISPSVGIGVTVSPSVLANIFGLPLPTISTIRNTQVSAAVLSSLFDIPVVTIEAIRNLNVEASLLTNTLNILNPTISAFANININADLLTLLATLPAPQIFAIRPPSRYYTNPAGDPLLRKLSNTTAKYKPDMNRNILRFKNINAT